MRKVLDDAGVPNELITVEGGGHGGFKTAEMERIYKAISAFLAKHHIGAGRSESARR